MSDEDERKPQDEDDPLLFELALLAAERAEPLDARYEAMARGDPKARAALEAQAATDDDRERVELYRPLDPAVKAQIEDAAARARSRPRWTARFWPLAAVAAAAVASAAIAINLGDWSSDQVAALPSYRLEAESQQTLRSPSGASGPVLLRPGADFQLILTPDTPVRASLEVEAFVERAGEERRPLAGAWEISENGAARLLAKVDDVLGESAAAAELIVFVRSANGEPREVRLSVARGELSRDLR